MMPTVKGGVCFKKGEPIPQKVLDAIETIKTPFGIRKVNDGVVESSIVKKIIKKAKKKSKGGMKDAK